MFKPTIAPVSQNVVKWSDGLCTALQNGDATLKSGQLVDINNDGNLSVFDYAEPSYIRAYHGSSTEEAISKYQKAKRIESINNAFLANEITKDQRKALLAGKSKAVATLYRANDGSIAPYVIKFLGEYYYFLGKRHVDNFLQVGFQLSDYKGNVLEFLPEGYECIGFYDL